MFRPVTSVDVSGPTDPGAPPPEVPEEFAAAYRAAYEEAIAAQTGGASHRDDTDTGRHADSSEADDTQDLPARRGPTRVGPRRAPQPTEVNDKDAPSSVIERITRSVWFGPLLLVLLALLLIFGAYTVGRTFAGRVGNDAKAAAGSTVVLGEVGDRTSQPPQVSGTPPRSVRSGWVSASLASRGSS